MAKKLPVKNGIKIAVSIIVVLLVPSFIYLITNNNGFGGIILFAMALFASFLVVVIFSIYYSFFYRWARILLGCLLGVVFLIILYNVFSQYKYRIEEWYANYTLPEEYKSYEDMDLVAVKAESFYHKKGMTLKLVTRYLTPNDALFYNKANQLIYYRSSGSTFMRYDQDGRFIDSLDVSITGSQSYEPPVFLGDYWVDVYQNCYFSWAVDGDEYVQPIIPVYDSEDWNDDTRKMYFKEVQKTADYFMLTPIHSNEVDAGHKLNRSNCNAKVVFFREKEWYYFYMNTPSNYGYEDFIAEKGKRSEEELFLRFKERATNERSTLKRRLIRPRYLSYDDYIYLDIATFQLKSSWWYNDEEQMKVEPTTFYWNKDESVENFSNFYVYQNNKVNYSLLKIEYGVYILK